jgi:hypothetical protein
MRSAASAGVEATMHPARATTSVSAAMRTKDSRGSPGDRVASLTRPKVWNEIASGTDNASCSSAPAQPDSQ